MKFILWALGYAGFFMALYAALIAGDPDYDVRIDP
jgi:hypothetical protein